MENFLKNSAQYTQEFFKQTILLICGAKFSVELRFDI